MNVVTTPGNVNLNKIILLFFFSPIQFLELILLNAVKSLKEKKKKYKFNLNQIRFDEKN